VYLIAHAGWMEAAKPRLIVETKGHKTREVPDFLVGKKKFKSDLISASLLIARYFPGQQAEIDALYTELSVVEQQMDELQEEHAGEEGLLEAVIDEKGKITAKSISTRLREIARDPVAGEERELLKCYAVLIEKFAQAKARLKAAETALNTALAAQYGNVPEPETKTIVVEGKWLAAIARDIDSEMSNASLAFVGRLREQVDRYAVPLLQIIEEADALAVKVAGHLHQLALA
jgi:type I restriction enzyme M protein